MSAGTVIVYRDNGVVIAFSHGTNDIGNPFLHFRIGSLNGIKFDGIAELPSIHRRYCSSTHTDPIIITAHDNYLIPLSRFVFQTVLGTGKTYTSRLHDYFVKAVLLISFLMFESQHTSTDQRLAEFVAKIAGSIGGFNQDVHRRLVKPFSFFHIFFPGSSRL